MGPLSGIKIVEITGIGPGPFCGMMLADMGAELLRVDRAQGVTGGDPGRPSLDLLARGRRSIGVDLKHPEGVATVLRLVEGADVIFEGFRPGVMERLGLGPDVCLERNPRVVYGRMTGWGQDGPLARAAGHDINYISLAGVLDHMGRRGEAPYPPLNLVGDFGGGGMLLAFGVVCGLFEARQSGQGQVVDAAMVDGASLLMAMIYTFTAQGIWDPSQRGVNLVDTGAPFYDVYETADGRHVAIGALEARFFAELLRHTGLDTEDLPHQADRDGWPVLRARLGEVFRQRTLDEWRERLEGTDVCFAPVLTMDEAYEHPHNQVRHWIVEREGLRQPAPAPRFSRTPGTISRPPAVPGRHTDEVLEEWGFTADQVAKLRDAGAVS